MGKRIILAFVLTFAVINAKSQFEQLDSTTLWNNSLNNRIDIHFTILKRNNPKEKIKKYRAFLIIANKDTVYLYDDSIIRIKNYDYTYKPGVQLDPMKLVVQYKNKKYELGNMERYIAVPVANIYFIINSLCIGNKFIHRHKFSWVFQKRKFYQPEIYTEPFSKYTPEGQTYYKPDSVIIKQNYKKNKRIIPYW